MKQLKQKIKKKKERLGMRTQALPLIIFNAFLLTFLLAGPIYAGIGLMNGKFSTGPTDEYLFWLQDYDGDDNYLDRFFIDQTGKVGINTSTPVSQLVIDSGTGVAIDVLGGNIYGLPTTPDDNPTVAVSRLYVDSNFFIQGGNSFNTKALIGTNDNFDLGLKTNNSEVLTITKDGKVGIGTTSPAAKLNIYGSNNSLRLSYDNANYASISVGSTGYTAFSATGSGSGFAFDKQINANYAGNSIRVAGNIYFNNGSKGLTNASGDLKIFPAGNTVFTSGNVAIGTTNPTTARLVVDDETGAAIDVAGGLIAGLGDPTDEDHAVSKLYADSNFLKVDAFIASSYWQLNGNNLFASSSDWQVGIGTSTPLAQLDIKANTNTEGLRIVSSEYSPLVIRDNANASDLFRLNQSGQLTTASSIKPGDDTTVCNASNSGAIKHVPSSTQTYICDGVRWLNQRNCGTVTDADGNTYGTVVIGGQCWMDENLKVGTMLCSNQVGVTSCSETPTTTNQIIQKWCYNNDPANCEEYGGLYDWNEAMRGSKVAGAQGICPSGWHIPTDAEWNILEKTVMQLEGGTSGCNLTTRDWQCPPAGTALKAIGQGTGTDKVGFKGLLSGYRSTNSSFVYLSSDGFYWSSTPSGPNAWRRRLDSSDSSIVRDLDGRQSGFSLRCLKD